MSSLIRIFLEIKSGEFQGFERVIKRLNNEDTDDFKKVIYFEISHLQGLKRKYKGHPLLVNDLEDQIINLIIAERLINESQKRKIKQTRRN